MCTVIKQNKLLLFRIDYLSILDQADRLTIAFIRELSLSTEQLFSYRERRLSEHLVDVEVRKVMRFTGENPKNEGKNEKINISW